MLKLKTLITEQEFKAKSKETGRVVVYKSKDSMDKAIKGGRAEPLDKKTSDKPEKVKGASLFKKDKPKSEPKKVPDRSGPGGDQETKDTLIKGLKTGLNPYQHSGLVIQVLDFVGDYPELTDRIEKLDPPTSIDKSGDYKPDAEYKKELDAFKEKENEVRNDIIKALSGKDVEVGTKIKDGKIKSSGPQQFADDVRKIKGEYELNGVKIKDGKMFDADGKEMDDDDIDDFYYQDAYDEKGINVGIDIKKISEVYLKKSLDLLNEVQVWERKFGEPLPTFSSVMEKHSVKEDEPEEPYDLSDFDPREDIDEQGALSKRAGINVFGDRKLQLMAKGLRQSAFDLEKVAKRKDEQAFDDILQRITITIGVIRSFLNKPKRSM